MRNLKFLALVVIIAAVLTVPVFAQVSPTNIATSGVFRTDVENSMHVHWFSNVVFEKWAGFAGYSGNAGVPASIGFATKFGEGIYLGTWYNGNFLSTTNNTKTETVINTFDITNQQLTTTETRTIFNANNVSSNNQLQALIGVAGMGFKVGFHENLTVWENPNRTITVTENKLGTTNTYANEVINFSQISGSMTPSLEWGTSIALNDEQSIRPRAALAFGINLNNQTLQTKAGASTANGTYTTNNGELIGDEIKNYSGNNSDYLAPSILVGADIDISQTTSVGISYRFNISIYDKSFNVAGFSGDVKGTIGDYTGSSTVAKSLPTTVTTTMATIPITDYSSTGHTIIPNFYYEKPVTDNITLGFLATLPVTINNTVSSTAYNKTYNTVKTVYNDPNQAYLNTTVKTTTVAPSTKTDSTSFSISPNLNFGVTYAFVPNRFTFNAGINCVPFVYTNRVDNVSAGTSKTTTTVITLNANNEEVNRNVSLSGGDTDTTTDTQTIVDNWTVLSLGATAGFKFNFYENMAIDMAVSSGGAASTQFNFTLTTVRAMFTLKF